MEHNYYSDREQTITLTSDSCSAGATDEFFTHLEKEVQLSGDWEVALDSLVYTKGSAISWTEDANHLTVVLESTSALLRNQFKISPTLYANVISDHMLKTVSTTMQMINAIVASITEMYGKGGHGSLTYTINGDFVKITVKAGLRIGISRELAHVMDLYNLPAMKTPLLPDMVWLESKTRTFDIPRKNVRSFIQPDEKPVKEIRICADFVEKQLIGNSTEPLLRCVAPSTKSYRSMVKHHFRKRRYIPVSKNVLQRLKLSIKGSEGQNNIVHSQGYTQAVLHLRPRSSNHLKYSFTKPLLA